MHNFSTISRRFFDKFSLIFRGFFDDDDDTNDDDKLGVVLAPLFPKRGFTNMPTDKVFVRTRNFRLKLFRQNILPPPIFRLKRFWTAHFRTKKFGTKNVSVENKFDRTNFGRTIFG